MAEAYLNQFGGEYFKAESAGLEPAPINPMVVEVMKEDGIDISNNTTDNVFDFFKEGKLYHYVISVCEEGKQRCPIFPSAYQTLYWSFPDPSSLKGTEEEKLREIRNIRDEIKNTVTEFVQFFQKNNYEIPKKEITLKLQEKTDE
jgi:arsenate reductase